MSHYLCHEQPDLLEFETFVVDARPGAVVLARSALHPGGGGQVSDVGTLSHAGGIARITGISVEEGRHWHLLDAPLELDGEVQVLHALRLQLVSPQLRVPLAADR